MRGKRIKAELKRQGLDMTRLARELDLPYGTVVCTINGYRKNVRIQEKIAEFLGQDRETLFGD